MKGGPLEHGARGARFSTMRLRKQLELLRELLADARACRERAAHLERIALKLARAWDAQDAAAPRAPRLPFPEARVQPASPQELEEPQDGR